MAQWFRALAVLLEEVDPGGWFPAFTWRLTSIVTSVPEDPLDSSGLCGHETCVWSTSTCAGKHYIHKIKFKIKKKTDYEFTKFTWKKCLYLSFHKNILTHFLVNSFMQNTGISVLKCCDEIGENTVQLTDFSWKIGCGPGNYCIFPREDWASRQRTMCVSLSSALAELL